MPLILTQVTYSNTSGKHTKGTNRRHKAEICEENKKRSPPSQLTWAEYH
jgi:hypothetical protein